MSTPSIRSATPADLPAIEAIENRCFPAARRSTRRGLRLSLRSPTQSVWVATGRLDGGRREVAAAMILHHHPRTLRIYSLAVLPAFRGAGIGRRLVARVQTLARRSGRQRVSLEADVRRSVLIRWYRTLGFETVRRLPDYYGPGRHAVRMQWIVQPTRREDRKHGRS